MTDLPAYTTVTTERLRLVPFAAEHAEALNAINNEPQVMQFLSNGQPQSRDQTRASIELVRGRWQRLGHSWWAIFLRKTETIIGAACLQNTAQVEGAELEIGWRLSTAATGQGYATEAGIAAARFAFDRIGVDHVVAVAHPDNINSHRVMQRIGMTFRGIETHYDADCTTYALHRADLA